MTTQQVDQRKAELEAELAMLRTQSDSGAYMQRQPSVNASSPMGNILSSPIQMQFNMRPTSSRSAGTATNFMPLGELSQPFKRALSFDEEQFGTGQSPIASMNEPHADIVKGQDLDFDQQSPKRRQIIATPRSSRSYRTVHVKGAPSGPATKGTRGAKAKDLQSATAEFKPNQTTGSGGSLPTPFTSPLNTHRTIDSTPLSDDLFWEFPKPSGTNVIDFQQHPGNFEMSPPMTRDSSQQSSIDHVGPHTPGPVSYHTPSSSMEFAASPADTQNSPASFDDDDGHSKADPELVVLEIDTGISEDTIQQYFTFDENDGKFAYGCSWVETDGKKCDKRFGRKENCRAHIQGHVGDRRFGCNLCTMTFTRRHDLQRHFKVHLEERPCECICGMAFARKDALDRHQERGICAGAKPGVVRTPVKRGRPRKNQPKQEQSAKISKSTPKGKTPKRRPTKRAQDDNSAAASPDSGISDDQIMMDLSMEQIMMLQNAGAPAMLAQQSQTGSSDAGASQHQSSGGNQQSQAGSPPELSHSSPPDSARLLDVDVDNLASVPEDDELHFYRDDGQMMNDMELYGHADFKNMNVNMPMSFNSDANSFDFMLAPDTSSGDFDSAALFPGLDDKTF